MKTLLERIADMAACVGGNVEEVLLDAAKEINALRAKIEAMKQQEPAAWVGHGPRDGRIEFSVDKPSPSVMRDFNMIPLYTLHGAQPELNLADPAVQKRLAAQWGYVPAPSIPDGCPPHAEIYVGDGMFVWCDWKDFDLVKKYNWNLTTRNRSGCLYAQSWDCHNTSERKRITMHGLIMPAPDGQFVDHINGNGLDNRRENLRLVTHQQNSFNQKHHGGSSKFKGVSIDRSSGSWRAYITVDGKRKHLGRHGTELDAAKAYDMAAKEFFGEYAKLNLESAPSPTTLDET